MKFAGKLLTTVAILVGMTVPAFADGTNCPYQVKVAINKYKAKDYVGCIQSLDDFIEKDPSNAIAYYYTFLLEKYLRLAPAIGVSLNLICGYDNNLIHQS